MLMNCSRGVKPGHEPQAGGRDGLVELGYLTPASLRMVSSPSPSPTHSGTGQQVAAWGRAMASSAIKAAPEHLDPSRNRGFLPWGSHTKDCQNIPSVA